MAGIIDTLSKEERFYIEHLFFLFHASKIIINNKIYKVDWKKYGKIDKLYT